MLGEAVQDSQRLGQTIVWPGLDLTGATLSGTIRSAETGDVRAIDGALVITDAAAGVFRWDYGTEDVSEAGRFTVQFVAVYGSGPTPAVSPPEAWRVHPRQTVTA